MGKLAYFARTVKDASMDRFNETVNKSCQLSGMSRTAVIADMVKSLKKFGAGYQDYYIFHFWDLNDAQRDTYLTRFRSKKLIEFMNDQSYSHIFDKKTEFNVVFKDFIGRETLNLLDETTTREDIIDFFDKRDKVFCKMDDLACGHGAELLRKEDFENGEDFYWYVKTKGFDSLEDVIENHPDIAKVYPNAVNTCRVITMLDSQGEPHVVMAIFKFGKNGRIVDNLGLYAPVDQETGAFLYTCHDGDTLLNVFYTEHPDTHYPLSEFRVPMIKEMLELAKKAATVIPQMRYIGWDIAVTPNGPAIIEGNDYSAHDFWQLPGQTDNGIGILPTIQKIIPEFKL